jgi:hypothetical protein
MVALGDLERRDRLITRAGASAQFTQEVPDTRQCPRDLVQLAGSGIRGIQQGLGNGKEIGSHAQEALPVLRAAQLCPDAR